MAKIPEYESLEEKRHFFSFPLKKDGEGEWLINTKDEFDGFYSVHLSKKGEAVYRGLSNSRHKLFTSGQRFWITNELQHREFTYPELITHMVDLIKKENGASISRFFNSLKMVDDDLAILSFIQHHGGPTPLLDFTKNISVSLYFATHEETKFVGSNDTIDNYFSIYTMPLKVDTESLKDVDFWHEPWKMLKYNFDNLNQPFRDKAYSGMKRIETYFGALVNSVPVGIIDEQLANLFGSQYITNMNILNQEGLFFFVNDEKSSFDELVNNHYNIGRQSLKSPKFIHCTHIHRNLIPYIKYKINIDEKYIFPNAYDIVWQGYNKALL